MRPTNEAKVRKIVETEGFDLEVYSGDGWKEVAIYSFKVCRTFVDTGCHTILRNEEGATWPLVWGLVLEDLQYGTEPCDCKDCARLQPLTAGS